MYNILIVDDEQTIRDGLVKYVKWDEIGYRVAGVAESSEDAINIVRNEDIDVVLTDIVMGEMSGLELIEHLKASNPNIKAIVLSGYDDFQYAREALRNGVQDYLVKPVKLNQLKNILEKIKDELDTNKQNEIINEENIVFLREQYINNIVKGYYANMDEITHDLNRVNLRLEDGIYYIARILIEISCEEHSKRNYIKNSINNFIEEKLKEGQKAFVFNNNLNEIAILMFMQEEDMKELLINIRQYLIDTFEIGFFIGVGRECNKVISLNTSYLDAGLALDYRLIKPQFSIIYYNEIVDFIRRSSFLNEDTEKNILKYLGEANEQGLCDCILAELNNPLIIENDSSRIIYDLCIDILISINKYISTNVEKSGDFQNYTYTSIRELLYKNKQDEIREFMLKYAKESIAVLKGLDEIRAGIIISNAKQYINEYYNEHITLEKLSQFVYVHPVYLSKLFKEKTGENFIDYLTSVRIERAKELLKNAKLKIYDISCMVGYESSKYFSKIFKDVTGLSPKEYRDRQC